MFNTEVISSGSGIAFSAGMERIPSSMRQATSESSSPSSPTAGTAGNSMLQSIETRFGTVQVNTENPLIFDHGLLGIPNSKIFALTTIPNPKLSQFTLLQSLEDKGLSFITMPLVLDNAIIEREDLEKAAADIGISLETLTLLLIVSIHRTSSAVQLSVNARAPLMIDTKTRHAMQYVFQHSRYKVQQFLSL